MSSLGAGLFAMCRWFPDPQTHNRAFIRVLQRTLEDRVSPRLGSDWWKAVPIESCW